MVASVVPESADEAEGLSVMKDCLRLEVSAETLLRLLASGQLCAADFRCLDCESKQCVWRLLLMSCEKTLKPGTACDGHCSTCSRAVNEDPSKPASVPARQADSPDPAADPVARQTVTFAR